MLPLFPEHVFVRMPWIDRALILRVPGVISLLAERRHALPLPELAIETMRLNLDKVHARPHPYLNTGLRANIQSGPLCGMEGILIHQGARRLIVMTLAPMTRSMAVVIDDWDLQRL